MNFSDKYSFPRPDFIRDNTILLNGKWNFEFDDDESFTVNNVGYKKKITVPFPYQSPKSGINLQEYHPYMWYSKDFELDTDKNVILNFGAVDHDTEVYVNGLYIGSHSGGYTPFSFDITKQICKGKNNIALKVTDTDSKEYVRGKQTTDPEPAGIYYTPVSGIWQDVWIELLDEEYITNIKHNIAFDDYAVISEVFFNKSVSGKIRAVISMDGNELQTIETTVKGNKAKFTYHIEDIGMKDNKVYNWNTSNPHIYDCSVTLTTDKSSDTVDTYFGFRKFSVINNKIYLNNSQTYLRMILDQGYWTEGIYRPEDNDGFRKDVEMIKEMGFNGVRKHQKIEDPKFYYWCDRLGIMVWEEIPSFYSFSEYSLKDFQNTLRETISRDYNHPCIVTYTLFNESWGVRKLVASEKQKDFIRGMYYYCKSLDESRPISSQDGWENITENDITSIHDYRYLPDYTEHYNDITNIETGSARTGHPYICPGEKYMGQPVMMTEFGSGDASVFDSSESYSSHVRENVLAIKNMKYFSGYCYTQLTDVYQETNGLLYMDRNPKLPVEEIKEIFGK